MCFDIYIQGFRKRMERFQRSTAVNLIREKNKMCLILLEKHKNSTWAVRPQDTLRFFFVR